jgi:hypothetical protein
MMIAMASMGATRSASAQSCPDPLDYSADMPILFHDEVPSLNVPAPQVPDFINQDCSGDDEFRHWCERQFAYVPSSPPAPNAPLFFFLHGAGVKPIEQQHVLAIAAYAGMPAIGISWDALVIGNAKLTRTVLCSTLVEGQDANDPDLYFLGGDCNNGDCLYDMGREMLTGDDLGTVYDPHPMRSITGKAALWLEDLHAKDINEDGVEDYHWAEYCWYDAQTGRTKLKTDDIVFGGFSMGASMASFISYTEGSRGTLALEGGADTCSITPLTSSTPAVLGAPDYVSALIPCDDPINGCNEHILVLNEDGAEVPPWSIVEQFGFVLDSMGQTINLDDYLTPTVPLDLANQESNIWITEEDLGAPHESVAVDASMVFETQPPAMSGPPEITNLLYVFPAYLEMMCSFN